VLIAGLSVFAVRKQRQGNFLTEYNSFLSSSDMSRKITRTISQHKKMNSRGANTQESSNLHFFMLADGPRDFPRHVAGG
jgi:hypothetical protein